jgi:putative heme-binding domain-containing protein
MVGTWNGAIMSLGAWSITAAAALAQAPASEADAYQQFALNHAGNASAGQILFERHDKLLCTNCHRITGLEKSGPNLDGIGDKYSRAELIRQVLHPSESIKPGYEQAVIVKRGGKVLTGRFERATKLGVRLLDPTGKQLDLTTDEIAELRYADQSLMPDNVVAFLSREQLADLIAYLETLRFGVKQGLAAGGRVVPISRLAVPVQFTTLHPPTIKFENPVWCGAIPGLPEQLVVLEHQQAKIWRYVRDRDHPRKELFADLSSEVYISGNQGLMCIAFQPDFTRHGRYFLEHEVQEQGKVKTAVVERRASDDRLGDSGRPSIRLFDVEQPAYNHNGGCIAFGPDGMLYAAFGDGGPQRDPNGYSQNPRVLLGSLVRIDVDRNEGDRPYAIPPDNPFLAAHRSDPAIRPETWAIGFREPWRFSFDALTGDLWLGDVGQDAFEEVSLVKRGENHGWNVREAFAPFSDQYRREGEAYADPLFAYEHGLGFSVTGGYVYRGKRAPSFYGVYIFGDYNTRRVWGLRQDGGQVQAVRELGTAPGGIASFGVDSQGELLLVTYGGPIFQLDLSQAEFR